jgi:tetratricopeptide (TPR) repeat protein
MAEPASRRKVLNELTPYHGMAFAHGTETEIPSILEILNKCIELDAVDDLVGALDMLVEDDSEREHLRRFRELADDWLARSMLRPMEREQVHNLVGGVPIETIRLLLSDPLLAGFVRFPVEDVVDGVDVCRRLEDLGPGPSGPPPLLILLELLAHTDAGVPESLLHHVIGQIRVELGRDDEVSRLCEQLGRVKSTESPTPGPESGEYTTEQPQQGDGLGPGDDVRTFTTPANPALSQEIQPLVWGGVPPQNANFVGREDLLGEIRTGLNQPDLPATVLQNALFGLGGVGKTQLAAEYAHRYRSEYRLVWWIPADDETSVVRSFVSLAAKLGVAERDDAGGTVHAALEALRQDPWPGHWLLIFDNAEDPDIVRNYLPGGWGHVLITSRSRQWKDEVRATVQVGPFSMDEGVSLLTQRWKGIDREHAVRLADRLGRLPLALVQATAFHTQTAMPLDEYLRQVDLNAAKTMAEGAAPGYPASVSGTFRLALQRLRERSEAAAQLLTVLSFISSRKIAISMLSRGKLAKVPSPLDEALLDDLQLRRAVGDLGRFALAQIDDERDLISVHMLVAEIIRGSLTPEEKDEYTAAAHSVLAAANPGEPNKARNWDQLKQITPHIEPSGILFSADPGAQQVVLDQIRYLYNVGQYAPSRRLGAEAVDTWRGSLGADHVMTLIASRHLANALRALGAYDDARRLDADTLERMRTTLGEDDPHTLAASRSYAADLRLQGAFHQALKLDEETWERHKRVLGDDDETTLYAANNVAVSCRLLGDFVRARTLDEEIVQRRTRTFRADHRETLFSFRMLARDMYGLGLYREALELQEEKLSLYERHLTVRDHAHLLYARRNMAILLRKVGDHTRALDYATRLYEVHRRRLGRRHEHTLASMVTLCNTLRVIGVDASLTTSRQASLARARELGEEAMATYTEVLGADHPFTLGCATDLAIVLRAVDARDEAMALDERTYVVLERDLGAEHPYSLCSASNMTNNLTLAGRPDEALELSAEVLERSRRARTVDHPLTLACAVNHALDLAAAGRTEEAQSLKAETHQRLTEKLGPTHPEVISMERGLRAECDIEPPEM